MRRWYLGFLSVAVAMLVVQSAWHFSSPEARANAPVDKRIRIGVYDPRAVAIAYAHSNAFQERLATMRKEMEQAKAANHQAKVKELQAQGRAMQLRLDLQGFAAAPVDDLLADVKDQLPQVADAADVQAITLRPDYTDPNAEIVDITDDLIKLWSPNAATLKVIADLEKTKPYPIERIAKMGPND